MMGVGGDMGCSFMMISEGWGYTAPNAMEIFNKQIRLLEVLVGGCNKNRKAGKHLARGHWVDKRF